MTNYSSPHWDRLTAEEQKQLLNSHDGPIPEQAMIDAAKTPAPKLDVKYLTQRINAKTYAIKSVNDELVLAIIENNAGWIGSHRETLAKLEKERDLLRDELAKLVPTDGQ